MTKVADARSVNRRHQYAGTLRFVDRVFQIRIEHVSCAVIEVNPIRGHEYLSTSGAFRPAFDQIADREIWAAIGSADSHGQAQCFCSQSVITGQILFDPCDAVLHVGNPNLCRGRLLVNELPQILQLCAQAGAG